MVLRQEIVIAFRTQRPVQLLREYVQVDGSLDQADDWTLAFHIIVLCAEVLTYCYGDEPKTAAAWDELSNRAQKWMDSKPVTFEPLLYRAQGERCDQVFPEIWLLNDCHGTLLRRGDLQCIYDLGVSPLLTAVADSRCSSTLSDMPTASCCP